MRFLKVNRVDIAFLQEASKNPAMLLEVLREVFPEGRLVINHENASKKLRTFKVRNGKKIEEKLVHPATGREQAYAYIVPDANKTDLQSVGMPDYIHDPKVSKQFFEYDPDSVDDPMDDDPPKKVESRYPSRRRSAPKNEEAMDLAGERRPDGVMVNGIPMWNYHAPQGGGSGGPGTSGMNAAVGNQMFSKSRQGKPFVLAADANLTHAKAKNIYSGADVVSSYDSGEKLSHIIVQGYGVSPVNEVAEPELLEGLSDHKAGVLADLEG